MVGEGDPEVLVILEGECDISFYFMMYFLYAVAISSTSAGYFVRTLSVYFPNHGPPLEPQAQSSRNTSHRRLQGEWQNMSASSFTSSRFLTC